MRTSPSPRVTIIATVLNEGASIRRLMDSLLVQTRQPDEVIIVDGGSQDDTVAILESYADRLPLRVIVEPGANISQGRNRAIAAASGEIIASTDAGVRLHPRWLEMLLAPFSQHPSVQVVSGFFLPDPQSLFEIAMGATVLPALEDVRADRFLPSSRSVAFTRKAWEAVGGYPEWLDYCEDLIFDFRLRDRFGPFAWAPDAIAYFRPRPSLRAFFLQYYRYARGDGKADLWRKRHLVRYTTYLVATPGLIALGLLHTPAWWGLLILGGLVYCQRPWQRLQRYWGSLSPWQRIETMALVPVIRLVGDVAKMIGYPVGLAWRWRHRQRPEIHWRESR
ncbi:MAG: glycosyltransferase [Chloroflexi bacterium]|nr:glycosyltransferase [Chloroflexota bacterium]